jgi:hypothetical protein
MTEAHAIMARWKLVSCHSALSSGRMMLCARAPRCEPVQGTDWCCSASKYSRLRYAGAHLDAVLERLNQVSHATQAKQAPLERPEPQCVDDFVHTLKRTACGIQVVGGGGGGGGGSGARGERSAPRSCSSGCSSSSSKCGCRPEPPASATTARWFGIACASECRAADLRPRRLAARGAFAAARLRAPSPDPADASVVPLG